MTIDQVLAQVQTSGWDTLRGAVADGLHDMPAAWVAAYDDLQALAAEKPPAEAIAAHGAPARVKLDAELAMKDWHAARDRQADALMRQLGGAYDRTAIIEQHINAALGERLRGFAADLAVIGPHAGKIEADDTVVEAAGGSREFADAWLRYRNAGAWYLRLRGSWLILRQHEAEMPLGDPLGVTSLLAEVRNAAQIRPDDWRNLRAGGQAEGSLGLVGDAGKWPTPVHARLHAILRDGGQVWLPSTRWQAEAYAPHVPDVVKRRMGIDPLFGDVWSDAQPRTGAAA